MSWGLFPSSLQRVMTADVRLQPLRAPERRERDASAGTREALRKSELNARQIAESLPQLVWTCDARGACDYLSPQWVAYTGLRCSSGAVISGKRLARAGSSWKTAESGSPKAGGGSPPTAAPRHQSSASATLRRRLLTAGLRTCASLPAKANEHGHVVKWFGTNTDVDTARHAELALREADRRKDEFLAMLGHELRNPLSAISNAAQLWKEARGR